ncbi:MAG: MgtC/SapB family protein [Paucibacter sp.]|nr:MgtC/SapB family protein [Roseateles sp.]
MQAFDYFDWHALGDMAVSLISAFVFGSMIGFERQVRQRTAGLRTNTLVAVGAAIFVSLGNRLYQLHLGAQGTTQIVAYVVSGIGFLGAGAIMKEGANVTGLNTAATLWGSGAVGACCGAGLIGEGLLAAIFVLASNTLLRPVVNRINRRPVNEEHSEASYTVYVICEKPAQADVHERLVDELESSSYPAREVDQHPFGPADTEIEAMLYATAVNADELDAVMGRIEQWPGVKQAFWSSSAD